MAVAKEGHQHLRKVMSYHHAKFGEDNSRDSNVRARYVPNVILRNLVKLNLSVS